MAPPCGIPKRQLFRKLSTLAVGVAVLGLSSEAWIGGCGCRSPTARWHTGRSSSFARGDGARESQELMDQLADDMDELMRLMQEGKEDEDLNEADDVEEVENEADKKAGDHEAEAKAIDVDDTESGHGDEAALVTVDTEASQVISALDLSGLKRLSGSTNEYIVTTQQLQSIVNSKVEQFKAVIKGFERYIGELEQELESTETQLLEKDASLQVELEKRQTLELELVKLKEQTQEMEQQLTDAQQAKQDATSVLADLDQQADQIAERVTSGEISEEESHEIEERLIRAQAKRLAASKTEERSEQQLAEVRQAAEEASQRALEAEERQQRLSQELENLQKSLQEAQEQRDAEAQKREYADSRFNQLVARLQERVRQC